MAVWTVKPSWKKSLHERMHYVKDTNRFVAETTWRWGEFTITTEADNPPILEEGDDLYDCDYDVELVECSDGDDCYDFDDCDDETREWLEEFLDENSYFDLEEHGWTQIETEMIISCEPEIELLSE
jgi:hypothetical protein